MTTRTATDYITKRALEIANYVEPGVAIGNKLLELYRIYAVLSYCKGIETTAGCVHDAWSAWQAGQNPSHKSLKPFEDLTDEVRRLDDPYVMAIHAAVNAEFDAKEADLGG